MRLQDILEIQPQQIRAMSDDELRATVKSLAPRLNKRLASLERQKLADYSPAYKNLQEEVASGRGATRFTSSLKTRPELEQEFRRMVTFQGAKTSYNKSARQQRGIFLNIYKHKDESKTDEEAADDYWHDFHRFKEAIDPKDLLGSDRLVTYFDAKYYENDDGGSLSHVNDSFHTDQSNGVDFDSNHTYGTPFTQDIFHLEDYNGPDEL